MGISLEHLEAFVTAADAGSFSAAARRMGKAQSRVSTAIGNLEIDLGLTLFDRSGKYPTLTPEGETLLRESRQIIDRLKALTDHADIIAGGVEPRLRVACDELVPTALVADLLGRFNPRFPATELELLTGVMGDISHLVAKGRADLGIEVPAGDPDGRCDWRHLGHLEFIIVAAAAHPLARLARVSREDLAPHLQLAPVGRGGGRESEAYLFGNRVWHFENSQIVRELILRGEGWGALAEYQIRDDLKAGRLVKLPVVFGNSTFTAGIYLVHEKGRRLGPAANWLAHAFVKAMA
ncbi:MAG: LysR family transcriptional regulator [Desulfobacteraceae bacterium]|nr:LysR family transcriptional regulator [Desulfobacteraceae bacterium]